MKEDVAQRLVSVAWRLLLGHCVVSRDISEVTHSEKLQGVTEFLSSTLNDKKDDEDSVVCNTLTKLQHVLESLECYEDEKIKRHFGIIEENAADAFTIVTNFQEKLLFIKISILTIMYLRDYFNVNYEVDGLSCTEDMMHLLSELSHLFKQLLDSGDAKRAVTDEFQRRGLTTSIWLRINQQTHTADGAEILRDVADLQQLLESFFHKNMLNHAFEVRNSHGAIVSLQLKQLSGHTAPITSLVLTPTHLYSGSKDKTIIVWDLMTHTQVSSFEGHDGGISALVVSPNGDMLYSSCDAGAIASWDLCIHSQTAFMGQCHSDPITSIALSSGRLFSADDKGLMKAWDACMIGKSDLTELEWPKQAHTHTITALVATDTTLISAGTYVKVWDSRTLNMTHKIKMHSGMTTALCIHGDKLYTGSRSIKVWNIHTLERAVSGSMKKHSHPVTAIAVSPDAKRLYSAAHVIKEWDLTTVDEEPINVLREHSSGVSSLAASHTILYSGSMECNDIYYRAIEDTSSSEVDCVSISRNSDSVM